MGLDHDSVLIILFDARHPSTLHHYLFLESVSSQDSEPTEYVLYLEHTPSSLFLTPTTHNITDLVVGKEVAAVLALRIAPAIYMKLSLCFWYQ